MGSVKIVRGGRAPQAIGVRVSFSAGQTRASNGVLDLPLDGSATVLVVTHDMQVARSCPRTITIRDGEIVGDDRR